MKTKSKPMHLSELEPGSILLPYYRDSGGDGQEQSIVQQRRAVENLCKEKGFVIGQSFVDEARSGGSTVGRDGFLKMVDYIQAHPNQIQGVVVWNFARFARELDDAMFYKAIIRRCGARILSVTDAIPDGDYGRLIEVMIDMANEEKLRQTSRDVKRSLRQLVEAGYSSGGRPPVGYLAEAVVIGTKRNGVPRTVSRWVIDPETVDDVRLAWKLRAEGRSFRELQDATGHRLFRSKNSWTSFFANRSYLGIGKCGSQEISDHHPAIVDQMTWDKVQTIQNAHPSRKRSGQVNHPRRQATPSLLSGVAVCAICGSAMVYNRTSGASTWPCYVCGKKQRHGSKT